MIITGLGVGAALGAVMQRGRFCVTGMIRDIWLTGVWRNFVALLVVISVHAIGIAALTSTGVITPDPTTFAPVAVVVGGFVFGLGIILSGGCASGTWYRAGEGLVGSWIALLFYALSAAAMKTGMLTGFNEWMTSWDTGLTNVPDLLGISPWWFAIALSLLTIVLVRYYLLKDAAKPKITLQGQPWYRKPMHMYLAAALIGLIGIIAWPLSAATGRNYGLGITGPSSDVVNYTTTGESQYLNWGTMLVIGLLIGSFFAAKTAGEFRVRVPNAKTSVRSIWGGILMGVGASLAGGCTVGNGMVETSMFSFQGWTALLFIALGVGVGVKLWIKPNKSGSSEPTSTYSTEQSLGNEAATSAEDAVINPGGGFQVATGLVSVATKDKVSDKARPLGEGKWALDTLGAVCPFPLVEAKDVMKTLDMGDALVIDFDCTQATDAIPQWAADDGHSITDFQQKDDAGWQITVVKGG